MKLTAERDMEDMGQLIDDLESAADDMEAIIDGRIVRKLRDVVLEWRQHTKPLIQKLAEEEA